jgi:hypothetical protein
MSRLPLILVVAFTSVLAGGAARGQLTPYNPYADAQESPAPLAADGTIQWGVFYKSAAIQQAYQKLWNMGACRGTNRRITEPVNRNKLIIDRLPEADYEGVVVAASGGLAGGMIAFRERDAGDGQEPHVVQLHPAGVTRLRVAGRVPAASVLRPGHVVRLVAEGDEAGEVAAAVESLDVITAPADFKPEPVEPGRRGRIVGTVGRVQGDTVTILVPAGRLRRLTVTLAEDAVATIEAAQLDLVSPGDTVQLTGRLWSGEGAMGAGTIFASDITVTKPARAGEVPGPDVAVARP